MGITTALRVDQQVVIFKIGTVTILKARKTAASEVATAIAPGARPADAKKS